MRIDGSEKVSLIFWYGPIKPRFAAQDIALGRVTVTRTPACVPIQTTNPTAAVKKTRRPMATVSNVRRIFMEINMAVQERELPAQIVPGSSAPPDRAR